MVYPLTSHTHPTRTFFPASAEPRTPVVCSPTVCTWLCSLPCTVGRPEPPQRRACSGFHGLERPSDLLLNRRKRVALGDHWSNDRWLGAAAWLPWMSEPTAASSAVPLAWTLSDAEQRASFNLSRPSAPRWRAQHGSDQRWQDAKRKARLMLEQCATQSVDAKMAKLMHRTKDAKVVFHAKDLDDWS